MIVIFFFSPPSFPFAAPFVFSYYVSILAQGVIFPFAFECF